MTDFISRSDLRHIAKSMRHDAPKDNDTYFVACEVLDYVVDKMPEPAPATISTNGSYNCCGHCGSIDGVLNMEGEHNSSAATAAGLSTGETNMTITHAREITRQFAHNFVATMRLEEAAEYKSVVDDAIEWAKANEPGLFYGIVHDYLNFLDRHTEHHICSTCKHWEPFTGACCGADSPYRADFVDGDCTCTDWKARLKK